MDISLALGSGGSRGFAHIGVLRILEREGYRIRAITGTSAGGIVAIGFAAGYSPELLEKAFLNLDQSRLFAHTPEEGPGILGLAGAARFFEELFSDRTFQDLNIPCAVVAVDLKAGREVVLQQGRLVDALLATVAVPGVFPPKEDGVTQLVDGGVLNPVPVSIARSLAPGLPVVAVVLEGQDVSSVGLSAFPVQVPVPEPIVKRLTRTRVAQAFNIFLQSVDVGSRMLAELRLIMDDPEVVIRPDVSGIGILDKVDIHAIVQRGEQAAEAVLPKLRRSVAWPDRFRRHLFPHK